MGRLEIEKTNLEEAREALHKERQQYKNKLRDLHQVSVDRKELRKLKREIKANRDKLEQQNNSIALQEGDESKRMDKIQEQLRLIEQQREAVKNEQERIAATRETF